MVNVDEGKIRSTETFEKIDDWGGSRFNFRVPARFWRRRFDYVSYVYLLVQMRLFLLDSN